MLTHLSIRNIVLIEACDIAFGAGLCVLTGETGAGKSILLDSLGLLLGARAEASLIRHGETQASVSAEFDISAHKPARAALEAIGMEAEATLVIRRTLSADGKSRAFINDQPASITALKQLGQTLIEIHGQQDQHGLLDSATHAGLLDAYGNHTETLAEVKATHTAWKTAKDALAAVDEAIAAGKREEELLRHMVQELSKLAPEPGEEETLSDKRTRIKQGEKLCATLEDVLSELNENKGVSQQLRSAARILMRSSLASDPQIAPVLEWLDNAANAADDATAELERLGRESAYDARALEDIEERLFALKAAARKYNISADELAGLCAEAEAKLALIDGRSNERSNALAAVAETKNAYQKSAHILSEVRRKTAAKLEKTIQAELTPLKMGGTHFSVTLTALPESVWNAEGQESVAFEIATNVSKGAAVTLQPLAKIASGGELSRFMLAMKVALAETRLTPTLIFDEIDTGTGGAVADAIGKRLGALGQTSQVLVVTHLPQVAARGNQHFTVQKAEKKGKVITSVHTLSHEERREELARMLAGAQVTVEARKAAEKLLEDAA